LQFHPIPALPSFDDVVYGRQAIIRAVDMSMPHHFPRFIRQERAQTYILPVLLHPQIIMRSPTANSAFFDKRGVLSNIFQI
jgi:hypothetical protein